MLLLLLLRRRRRLLGRPGRVQAALRLPHVRPAARPGLALWRPAGGLVLRRPLPLALVRRALAPARLHMRRHLLLPMVVRGHGLQRKWVAEGTAVTRACRQKV